MRASVCLASMLGLMLTSFAARSDFGNAAATASESANGGDPP